MGEIVICLWIKTLGNTTGDKKKIHPKKACYGFLVFPVSQNVMGTQCMCTKNKKTLKAHHMANDDELGI